MGFVQMHNTIKLRCNYLPKIVERPHEVAGYIIGKQWVNEYNVTALITKTLSCLMHSFVPSEKREQ